MPLMRVCLRCRSSTGGGDEAAKRTFHFISLPSQIEDWGTQLNSTMRFADLLTHEDGIASEAHCAAPDLCDPDLHDQNKPTFCAAFQDNKLMEAKALCFLDRVQGVQ